MKKLLLFGLVSITFFSIQAQYPELVKDIYPGSESGRPIFLTEYNDLLYFQATDTLYNWELWVTDGTESGTLLFKEIDPDPLDGSSPCIFTNLNGKLYFEANDGVHDMSLWMTDGTLGGTTIVKDSAQPEQMYYHIEVCHEKMYFNAKLDNNDKELWISDGTSDGTHILKQINPSGNGSNPNRLTDCDGILYFFAKHDMYGYEPWISDGTEEGTVLLKDINPGEGNSVANAYRPFFNYEDKVYFVAYDTIHGAEFWVTDGTTDGTVLLKDILPGKTGSYKYGNISFIVFDGYLYFNANDSIHGYELWRTDGTTNGTTMVEDLYPGEISAYPYQFTISNDKLYFVAETLDHGREIYCKASSSQNSIIVKDIVQGPESSYPSYLDEYNGFLYFKADDGTNGYELWVSDGTSAGTYKISPVGSSNYDPLEEFWGFTFYQDYVYFMANYDEHGAELHKLEVLTSIDEPLIHSISDFQLYPNPAQAHITLNFELKEVSYLGIYLNSLDGKEIQTLNESNYMAGEHKIQLSLPKNLPAGMYMVDIRANDWSHALMFIKK